MSKLDPKVAATLAALSIQKRRFVVAYCSKARGNGGLAAKLAGVSGSTNTHRAWASQMLKMPKVRAAVNAWMEAYAMTAVEVTERIRDMSEANMGPFAELQPDGRLKVKSLSEEDWEAHKHWIKSIKADGVTGMVVEIKLHDSLDALKEMAKIRKLYSDAPIFVLNQYLLGISDEELLKQYEEARASSDALPLAPVPKSLGAGETLAEVVVEPEDVEEVELEGGAEPPDEEEAETGNEW